MSLFDPVAADDTSRSEVVVAVAVPVAQAVAVIVDVELKGIDRVENLVVELGPVHIDGWGELDIIAGIQSTVHVDMAAV